MAGGKVAWFETRMGWMKKDEQDFFNILSIFESFLSDGSLERPCPAAAIQTKKGDYAEKLL